MGWSGGTYVMCGLIRCLNDLGFDKIQRQDIYLDMIDVLTDQDWDCINEPEGEDEAYDEAYAIWKEENGYEDDEEDEEDEED